MLLSELCLRERENRDGDTIRIILWLVRALNADWLTAVAYQTVYHGYDKTIYFPCSNYVGNQFITAIRNLWGLWYIANIPGLRAVSRHSALHVLKNSPSMCLIS